MRRIAETLRLCTWESSYLECSSSFSSSGKLLFIPRGLAQWLLPLWSLSWVPVCFTVLVPVTGLCLYVWLHKISLLWGSHLGLCDLISYQQSGATDNPHNSTLTASSFPPMPRTSRPYNPLLSPVIAESPGVPRMSLCLVPSCPKGAPSPQPLWDFLLTFLSRAMWGGKMALCSLRFLP